MPIRIPNNLPARGVLESENIFVMTEARAESQQIRPLRIGLLNLMPTKITTETQLSRLLGNTPLQVELFLIQVSSHRPKNTPQEHMIAFYQTFDEIKDEYFESFAMIHPEPPPSDHTHWPAAGYSKYKPERRISPTVEQRQIIMPFLEKKEE